MSKDIVLTPLIGGAYMVYGSTGYGPARHQPALILNRQVRGETVSHGDSSVHWKDTVLSIRWLGVARFQECEVLEYVGTVKKITEKSIVTELQLATELRAETIQKVTSLINEAGAEIDKAAQIAQNINWLTAQLEEPFDDHV